ALPVAPPGLALPRAACPVVHTPGRNTALVARHTSCTARASAAPRVPIDDDVQRDHSPRRRGARHPCGPVRPRRGRTVTSRSGGAIEGEDIPPPCPRYVRRGPTVADASSGRCPRRASRCSQSPPWCPSPRLADHLVAVTGDLHRDPW